MWRARPSLSGATCPAGSKTSCCESFIRALLSLNLLFHSLLCCSVICFSSSSWVFSIFLLPHFLSFSLYPRVVSPDSFCLSTPPTSASSSFSLALPRCISPSRLISQPWLSPSPFSLLCHLFLMWLFDLHQLSPLLLWVSARIFLSLPLPPDAAVQASESKYLNTPQRVLNILEDLLFTFVRGVMRLTNGVNYLMCRTQRQNPLVWC